MLAADRHNLRPEVFESQCEMVFTLLLRHQNRRVDPNLRAMRVILQLHRGRRIGFDFDIRKRAGFDRHRKRAALAGFAGDVELGQLLPARFLCRVERVAGTGRDSAACLAHQPLLGSGLGEQRADQRAEREPAA